MNHARLVTFTLAALVSASTFVLAQPAAPAHSSGFGQSQAPPAATMPRPVLGTSAPQASQTPQAPRIVQPRQLGQLVNVKVEFTITDQVGTKPPVKKTMTMVVADKESSRIRTNVEFWYGSVLKNDKGEAVNSVTQRGVAPLSVDVSPVIEGNKVRLEFSIEYSAADMDADGNMGSKTTVSERLAAVFDSGVPLVVAQSSDAYSDRKITVEIKATILK